MRQHVVGPLAAAHLEVGPGVDRVRIARPARVTDGRDMIDVDVETNGHARSLRQRAGHWQRARRSMRCSGTTTQCQAATRHEGLRPLPRFQPSSILDGGSHYLLPRIQITKDPGPLHEPEIDP